MITTNSTPFTMPVQPACNSGFGGNGMWGDGSWLFIILILLIFGWGNGNWGGNGFGGGQSTSVYEGYVLNNDFSQLSKQISDTYNMTDRKFEGIANGMCSMGYETQGLINGVNTNIMSVGNAIQTQLAQCCCDNKSAIADVKYTIGSTGAEISRGVERGFADTNYNLADKFCQTNFNMQNNTRDVIDSNRADTRAILDKLCQMESNAKDEKIAELTARNADLRLAASQAAQNNYLVDKLGYKMPIPAFQVPNPFCNCNCNQNFCGTTIS